MKGKSIKRQVRLNQPYKPSSQPIVINTSPSKSKRSIKRGGCCMKRRT